MTASNLTIDNFANLCKAVSEPLRVMVLRVLLHNSFGVLELTQLFNTTQSGMSHHLKVLLQAGLVVTRREGNTIFYRRTLSVEHSLSRFHQSLLDEIDGLAIPDELQHNLNIIYAERAEASRIFFTNLAKGDGLDQQDVIVDLKHYQDNVLKIIDSKGFNKEAIALEVGPGDGKFLPLLAKRFKEVIAVDNNAEMLQLAEQYCQQQKLPNVILKKADATKLQLTNPLDCIVANMVLHHLPAPADAFQHFKSCLKESGNLLVAELCHHEQDWVTKTCGDLWLGFEPDELTHWASSAGFKPDESLYIGLRNGFQLQIRCFCAV
ncbi:metalloregulator ArsR/SmtB family transcription factor [Entomomonas asaccharolytica]|uniref:ArsR family transcriptional regulator n=1 Tax=Entomomonas asaccharolytica TaxID=2785331 RepID=A0A974NGL1_9GAMM|nr:metalloregulator ArsR/SmtB family transcription factor [Entomomonas asaccharolytica]QQP86219.1 ArsR family transcriptional regulator [Entomomonas asaccharolytica]